MPTTTVISTVTKKEITKQITYSEAEIKAIVAKKEGVNPEDVVIKSDGVSISVVAEVVELKESGSVGV